jgi:hypothetical protein
VVVAASLTALMSGCTAVSYTPVPARTSGSGIFLTAEGVEGPYQSLGVIQLTRKGMLVFGFWDPVGTDLAGALEEIQPQIRASGADGLVNVRVHTTPFTTADRVLGAILFFAPRAAQVTITGELVKMGAPTPTPEAQ